MDNSDKILDNYYEEAAKDYQELTEILKILPKEILPSFGKYTQSILNLKQALEALYVSKEQM